jgi:hypothetical protein
MSAAPAAAPGAAPAGAPPGAPPGAPRRRWLTVLLCSAIFLAGGVVGGGVTAVAVVRRAQDAILHPEDAPRRIALRLQRRLDLEPGQTRAVEHIIARHQAALLDVRAQMLDRAAPDLDLLEVDVASVLKPAQVERWRRHYRELRDDWAPRFPRRPPRDKAPGEPR